MRKVYRLYNVQEKWPELKYYECILADERDRNHLLRGSIICLLFPKPQWVDGSPESDHSFVE